MRYTVTILPSAAKKLDSIPQTDATRISIAINHLAEDPRPIGCIKLSGRDGWRIRWKPAFRMVAVDSRLKPTTNHNVGTYLWKRDSESDSEAGQSQARAERLGHGRRPGRGVRDGAARPRQPAHGARPRPEHPGAVRRRPRSRGAACPRGAPSSGARGAPAQALPAAPGAELDGLVLDASGGAVEGASVWCGGESLEGLQLRCAG